jgi:NADH-quinone oxidoreductase subunit N
VQDFDLTLVLPVVILASYGLLALLLAPFFRDRSRILAGVSLLGIVMATASTAKLWQFWGQGQGAPITTAHGMVQIDGFGLFMTFILLIVGAMTIAVSPWILARDEADHGEFYALVLFALAGMIAMVHTTNLIVVLVGLEVFSLSLYVLCGLTRLRLQSVESALKYFLLGAFSSGFLVYGLALLYGAVGSLDMGRIGEAASRNPSPMLWTGMGLVLIGLAFKIAVVPFHQWVPDVYQGAPTNVTGFMAAATKVAAFATMLRFLVGAFGDETAAWIPLVTWLAVLTMTVANLVALAQSNIKRLLAFSSIAHAGTLLIGFACEPQAGIPAILFYLSGYAFMTVGAFAVAAVVGRGDARSEAGYDLASWAGLGRRNPVLATAMTVFLLSLAGLPPTAGFLGKYLIFEAAIESKQYFLAVAGVLNAVVATYYYLRIVISMWMQEAGEAAEDVHVPAATAAALAVAVLAVFYLGMLPGRVLEMAQGLAASLL